MPVNSLCSPSACLLTAATGLRLSLAIMIVNLLLSSYTCLMTPPALLRGA